MLNVFDSVFDKTMYFYEFTVFIFGLITLSPDFVRPDLAHHVDGQDKDLPVPYLSSPGTTTDNRDDRLDVLIFHDELELDLREDINLHRPSPLREADTLLLSPAPHLCDAHGDEAFILQGPFHVFKSLRPDYRLNHFHRITNYISATSQDIYFLLYMFIIL